MFCLFHLAVEKCVTLRRYQLNNMLLLLQSKSVIFIFFIASRKISLQDKQFDNNFFFLMPVNTARGKQCPSAFISSHFFPELTGMYPLCGIWFEGLLNFVYSYQHNISNKMDSLLPCACMLQLTKKMNKAVNFSEINMLHSYH